MTSVVSMLNQGTISITISQIGLMLLKPSLQTIALSYVLQIARITREIVMEIVPWLSIETTLVMQFRLKILPFYVISVI